MSVKSPYIEQIVEQLRKVDPYLVILFGSYAYGKPHEDSDIDLLVVTNDNFIPENFKEHSEIYLNVSQVLRPVKKHIGIDLLVYTIPMYRKFIEINSSFAFTLSTRGKIIYESDHSTVA